MVAPQRRNQRVDPLVRASRYLTDRDRYLCRILFEHRVLTTHQVTDVAFDSPITARHRLAALADLDVVDRFRPRKQLGSAPWHWVLGPVGAAVLAVDRGEHPDDFYFRSEKALAVEASPRLAHLLGVNGFFTALVREARRAHGRCSLAEWRSERAFAARWGDLVRPDGFGRWIEDGTEVRFCLEFDNGTENLARLTDKLIGYADLAVALGEPPLVLFAFQGPRREAAAVKALARSPVPVATAVVRPGALPAERIWLVAGRGRGRFRLKDFGTASDDTVLSDSREGR
jgi:hypothetical protein